MSQREWPNTRYVGGIPTLSKRRSYKVKIGRDRLGLFKGRHAKYEVPLDCIIDVRVMSYLELSRPVQSGDKSVIGRAVLGGVLFGPIGAVVGGMSATASKPKMSFDQSLNKNEIVVVVDAEEAGVQYRFGLIVPAVLFKRGAADKFADAVQSARMNWARHLQRLKAGT